MDPGSDQKLRTTFLVHGEGWDDLSPKKAFFFKVRSERNRLEQANPELKITAKHLSEALDVRESDVEEMEVYMAGRDFSLDAPLTVDAGVSHVDMLEDDVPTTDSLLASKEEHSLVHDALSDIVESCNEKERYIIAALNDVTEGIVNQGMLFFASGRESVVSIIFEHIDV